MNRMRSLDRNALASSIVLAYRPRPSGAGIIDRRGLLRALRDELPESIRHMQQAAVAPVDLRQAAIGPGMAVFSVKTLWSKPTTKRSLLAAIGRAGHQCRSLAYPSIHNL